MFKKIFYLILLIPFIYLNANAIESWEMEAGIEVPFQIGARAKANFNSEFYGTFGAGLSLDFLMGIQSAVSSGVGILGEATAEVAESALSNSAVIEFRGGWNLHQFNGLYIEAGYLYMMGGGKEVSVDSLEQAYGTDYATDPLQMSNSTQMSISSDLHALTIHSGYRWELGSQWLINFDVGLIKPFLSTTNVDIDQLVRGTGSQLQAEQVALALKSKAEKETDSVFLQQMFIPTASFWVSYLF
jgi:hypothetical protein